MKFKFQIILICCILSGCANDNKIIILQPFGDFPKSESQQILGEVSKLKEHVILLENAPFPATAYYKPRGRYRADKLIRFLKRQAGSDSVMVGLSNRDISTTNGDIYDWGVMGLGYQPGRACVVSNFRLPKSNRREQFYKVVLHEIGHTQGLPHCPIKTCFMRDAEGGNPLHHETGFCKSCANHLKERNWKL